MNSGIDLTGYRHPLYPSSLAEFGEPRRLPYSGGWLLERLVPGGPEHDAMGCYPIFSAHNWEGLARDLEVLSLGLVSVSLVADPFGEYLPSQLSACFDPVVPFKEHYIVDFSKPLSVSKHHAYYAKKATAAALIEVGPPPPGFAAQWSDLYEAISRRHGLRGIKAFSRKAFELQLSIPGMVVFRAIENGLLVGAHLWYEHRDVAYSHLAASNERGYKISCSYAIHSAAIEYFRSRVKYVDLGAGAGLTSCRNGLSYFKEGWTNQFRTAYFCGRILNPERYNALTQKFQKQGAKYFPAYRSGELG